MALKDKIFDAKIWLYSKLPDKPIDFKRNKKKIEKALLKMCEKEYYAKKGEYTHNDFILQYAAENKYFPFMHNFTAKSNYNELHASIDGDHHQASGNLPGLGSGTVIGTNSLEQMISGRIKDITQDRDTFYKRLDKELETLAFRLGADCEAKADDIGHMDIAGERHSVGNRDEISQNSIRTLAMVGDIGSWIKTMGQRDYLAKDHSEENYSITNNSAQHNGSTLWFGNSRIDAAAMSISREAISKKKRADYVILMQKGMNLINDVISGDKDNIGSLSSPAFDILMDVVKNKKDIPAAINLAKERFRTYDPSLNHDSDGNLDPDKNVLWEETNNQLGNNHRLPDTIRTALSLASRRYGIKDENADHVSQWIADYLTSEAELQRAKQLLGTGNQDTTVDRKVYDLLTEKAVAPAHNPNKRYSGYFQEVSDRVHSAHAGNYAAKNQFDLCGASQTTSKHKVLKNISQQQNAILKELQAKYEFPMRAVNSQAPREKMRALIENVYTAVKADPDARNMIDSYVGLEKYADIVRNTESISFGDKIKDRLQAVRSRFQKNKETSLMYR